MRARKVKSVRYIGLQKTMDIEVGASSHVFYGDGIVTSNSHSVAYAVASCRSAWYKANYTKEFFAAYLYHADEKQEPHQEIYELISEAKLFDIEVKLPKISNFSEKFIIRDDGIYFGIKDIKSLAGVAGDKVIETINETAKILDKNPADFSWLEILLYLSPKINSTAFKALCSIGFFSTKTTGVTRNRSLYEYGGFKQLTKTELAWVQSKYKDSKWANLIEVFTDLAPSKKAGGGTSSPSRNQTILTEINMLEDPPYELSDDPSWIVEMEKKFLGCPVSLSKIDAVDSSIANTSCRDILNGKMGKDICVVANVARLSNHKIKKSGSKQDGRTMCFLTIEDSSCSFDGVVVFPDIRDKYQYILYEGNNLMFCGEVDKSRSFMVEKIHEI